MQVCSSYIALSLGTRHQRGQPGNPGNLRIRTSMIEASGHWVNYFDMDVQGVTTSLRNVKIDLKKGEVSF